MSLRQSAEILRARVAEHHEVDGVAFLTIVCDRCEHRVMCVPPTGSYADDDFYVFCEAVFNDWDLGDYGENRDHCPRCR